MSEPSPTVMIPVEDGMAEEPVRTIGQQFANISFIKTLVGAAVTILGIVAPHLASGIDTNEANAISLVVVVIAGAIASYRARSVPKEQAAKTREWVWPAQSVADIQAEARAGSGEKVDAVVIEPPPATASK